jgi:lysophospholipase L1-like esterase
MRLETLASALVLVSFAMPRPSAAQAPAPAASAPAPAAAAAPARIVDFPNLKRYQPDNAALPPASSARPRVVFMGDSITQGWAAKRPAFFESNAFVGRGISGQTTSQMVLRFHQDVVALQPAAVFILAGTNDVAENTGPVTDEQVIDNLAAMVEIAHAHGIAPIIGSIPPATTFSWRKEIVPTARIQALNAKIKAWAQQQSLPYADIWSAMALPDGGMKPDLATDSVHPNDAGYAVMEPVAQSAIASVLKAR